MGEQQHGVIAVGSVGRDIALAARRLVPRDEAAGRTGASEALLKGRNVIVPRRGRLGELGDRRISSGRRRR